MTTLEASEKPQAVGQRVAFRGHPLVRATHPTTIEITTEDYLTESGDCIIGIMADHGCLGLDEALKSALRNGGAKVGFTIRVGSQTFSFAARGDPGLTLTDPHDAVIRRSGFLSPRTLAVGAGAAAKDIPRTLVTALRSPDTVGYLEVEVR